MKRLKSYIHIISILLLFCNLATAQIPNAQLEYLDSARLTDFENQILLFDSNGIRKFYHKDTMINRFGLGSVSQATVVDYRDTVTFDSSFFYNSYTATDTIQQVFDTTGQVYGNFTIEQINFGTGQVYIVPDFADPTQVYGVNSGDTLVGVHTIYYESTPYGVVVSVPTVAPDIDDADADPTNEIQDLQSVTDQGSITTNNVTVESIDITTVPEDTDGGATEMVVYDPITKAVERSDFIEVDNVNDELIVDGIVKGNRWVQSGNYLLRGTQGLYAGLFTEAQIQMFSDPSGDSKKIVYESGTAGSKESGGGHEFYMYDTLAYKIDSLGGHYYDRAGYEFAFFDNINGDIDFNSNLFVQNTPQGDVATDSVLVKDANDQVKVVHPDDLGGGSSDSIYIFQNYLSSNFNINGATDTLVDTWNTTPEYINSTAFSWSSNVLTIEETGMYEISIKMDMSSDVEVELQELDGTWSTINRFHLEKSVDLPTAGTRSVTALLQLSALTDLRIVATDNDVIDAGSLLGNSSVWTVKKVQ